ncbi:hypothetical protein J2785_004874 [Burkholderia ambifaria]|nr:hypothetical protein [Burkholderia ambifaria]
MSSGLVVIELEGNARPREPRRSGFDATRRQAAHVGKREIRPQVRCVVHDSRQSRPMPNRMAANPLPE